MASDNDLLTFPENVLADGPVRLPIVHRGDGWIALAKPPGIGAGEYGPADRPGVVRALRTGISRGGGQYVRLGFKSPAVVNELDSDLSGIVIVAGNEAATARLKQALGSNRMEFVFTVVVAAELEAEAPKEAVCELPLGFDEIEGRAYVSHRDGRKASTRFSWRNQAFGHAVWEARTFLPRRDQIRVHAVESRLWIAGENLYGNVRPVRPALLKPRVRKAQMAEASAYPWPCVHLGEVIVEMPSDAALRISAPPPKAMESVLRILSGRTADKI
jgi:23S rRNA-/tRNA-specific pseudouridylate synthase